MVAHVCDLQVGDFVHSFGDAHLYVNHIEQAKLQLQRVPNKLPNLVFNAPPDTLEAFKFEHIQINDYIAAPTIKAPISV